MADPKPPDKTFTAGMEIESNGPGVPENASGSLGCFALDSAAKPVLLTCSHVMFPAFQAFPNTGIYQPDYSPCCSGGDRIASAVYDKAEMANSGKFQGGFMTTTGKIQTPAPNDAGYTTVNGKCAETDCAIARLEKGIKF